MPADLPTLRALKARVDAATGADMHLDHAIEMAFAGPPPPGKVWSPDPEYAPAYTASIDAAVGLVERVLPPVTAFGAEGMPYRRLITNVGYLDGVYQGGAGCTLHHPLSSGGGPKWHGFGKSEPLAILSAMVAVLIAQAEAGAEESATDIEEHP